MTKLISILILVAFSSFCVSKEIVKNPAGGAYHVVVLTKDTYSKSSRENEHSIVKYVYINNRAGDSLAVYTLSENALSTATVYTISNSKSGLCFYARPINANQETSDSVRIDFNDPAHQVLINKTDRYTLYPTFYTWFKQQVQTKRAVMAILNLLGNSVGDYPVSDTLPLLFYAEQLSPGKSVVQAHVVTTRSQATDVTDSWNCVYHYNRSGKMDSVKASNNEETRFYKKISYAGNNITAVKYYSNIESRQVVDGTISYSTANKFKLKWNERVFEPGKNLETRLSSTLNKRDLGQVKSMMMTQAELLNLVK